jgi:hypothetical protein
MGAIPGLGGGGGVSSIPDAIKYLLANDTGAGLNLILDNYGLTGDAVLGGTAILGLSILNDTVITSFTATNLVTASVAISLYSNSALVSVDFPAITTIGAGGILTLNANALTSALFPSLTTIAAGCSLILDSNALTSLSLSALTTLAGNLSAATNAALASVTLPASVATADGFSFDFSGCALSQGVVNNILAAFAAGIGATTSGTINISGGTSAIPAESASNADLIALQAAGINVTVNA